MDTYLFIDGAHLDKARIDLGKEFFGEEVPLDYEKLLRLRWGATEGLAHRAFYYDCGDDARKEGEPEAVFQERQEKKNRHLLAIGSASGYHVRRGTLRAGGRREQKEVDVLLTVDMLQHAYRRNMSKAVLIAGDLDFRPVVQALVDAGTYVVIAGNARSLHRDLMAAADDVVKISPAWLYDAALGDFMQKHFPIRVTRPPHELVARPGDAARTGRVGGHPATLSCGNKFYSIWVGPPSLAPHGRTFSYNDLAQLEKVVELDIGKVEWDPT